MPPVADPGSPVRYRPCPGVEAASVRGELVLLDLERGEAFRLNRTAKRVWELAVAKCTFEETVQLMAASFAVPRAQLEQDVRRLLAQLVGNRLVEAVPTEVP